LTSTFGLSDNAICLRCNRTVLSVHQSNEVRWAYADTLREKRTRGNSEEKPVMHCTNASAKGEARARQTSA